MMTKALYERVIIEILSGKPKEQFVEGLNDEKELVKVKIHDWGTLVDGSSFPYPVNAIGYMKQGPTLTIISEEENRYLVDRRLILGVE